MTQHQASWLPLMMMGGGKENSFNWWMLFIILLSSISGEIMLYIKKNSLCEFIRRMFTANQKVYSIKADITKKNNIIYGFDIPIAFSAIMYKIEQHVSKDSKVNYTITERALTHCRKMKMVQFNNRYVPYALTDDISIMIDWNDRQSERGDYNFLTFAIHIMSKSRSMTNIVSFIDTSIEDYDEHQESICKNKLKIFTLTGIDKEAEQKMIYHEMPFETSKTFNTMFFEEKNVLMSRIDQFKKDKERYQELGMPYTLGMLFSGKPGTGKTSAIKALAKHSDRHVIRIPVKLIDNSDSLQLVFLSERINNYKIPMEKRLYVFEEIDCSAWQKVVLSRHLKNVSPDTKTLESKSEVSIDKELADSLNSLKQLVSGEDMDVKKPGSKLASPRQNTTEKADLTLGDLLDILDGIVEMPGRMIVMTSNHPEKLDEALLRPGRIDLKIDFKALRAIDVSAMYKLWFDKDLPENVLQKITDYKYTQADIGNLFSMHDEQYILSKLLS